MSRLLPPTLVLIVWLALWGEVSWANLVSGVLVVALIGLIIRPVPRGHDVHPVHLIKLLAIFMGRLVSSSMVVVMTVIRPTPSRMRSGVVSVRMSQPSPLVATVVADAISLTPGTLTLDVREGEQGAPVLYIHVLGLGDPAEIHEDIAGLEQLVVAAITPIPDSPTARFSGARPVTGEDAT